MTVQRQPDIPHEIGEALRQFVLDAQKGNSGGETTEADRNYNTALALVR
jgi:hypothetical protein